MTAERREKLLRFGNDTEPFLRHNGIRFTDVADGAATATLTLCRQHLNHWDAPHGGVLFALCDEVCGMATVTLRPESCVTVNLTMDFIAAAGAQGQLTAVGKVEKAGGKICFCSAQVHDDAGKLIAAGHSVMCFTGRALPL